MKELNDPIKDNIQVVGEQKQVKQVASIPMHSGHSIWELDLNTKLIKRIKADEVNATMGKLGIGVSHKITQRPGCLYFSALNAQSADKQAVKLLIEQGYIKKAAGKRLLQIIKLRGKKK